MLMSRHVRAERLIRSCRGIFVGSFAVWGLRGWESVEVCLDGKVLEATNILNLTLAFLMLNH